MRKNVRRGAKPSTRRHCRCKGVIVVANSAIRGKDSFASIVGSGTIRGPIVENVKPTGSTITTLRGKRTRIRYNLNSTMDVSRLGW